MYEVLIKSRKVPNYAHGGKFDTEVEVDLFIESIKAKFDKLGYESLEDMDISVLLYNDYKEKRVLEYGSICDQLDEIYHDIDAWRVRIKLIKDKYPKE